MISDPRISSDAFVREALAIWDRAFKFRDAANTEAAELSNQLRLSDHHQAYGWAVATCGRVAAYRKQIDLAEALLTEALGRFILADDKYGNAVITCHLAIPQAIRGNLDRCLELAKQSLEYASAISARDLALMHSIAAMCYSEREEFSAAIFHLNNEYEIIKMMGDEERQAIVTGNMGLLLLRVGELELSRKLVTQAWEFFRELCPEDDHRQVVFLGNLIAVNCHLDRTEEAAQQAEQLIRLSAGKSVELPGIALLEIAEALARTGHIRLATQYLERARSISRSCHYPQLESELVCAEAVIHEASGQTDRAIALSKSLINAPTRKMAASPLRTAAATLSRCYSKLGDKRSSEYWSNYRKEIGRGSFLDEILSNQIRANLRVEQPSVALTEKELSCLKLSANGQTSIDIGMKLGIKPRTVNFHFSKILRKLNAMNRQEAIAKAANANLLK